MGCEHRNKKNGPVPGQLIHKSFYSSSSSIIIHHYHYQSALWQFEFPITAKQHGSQYFKLSFGIGFVE
jgi:hypothetical protein